MLRAAWGEKEGPSTLEVTGDTLTPGFARAALFLFFSLSEDGETTQAGLSPRLMGGKCQILPLVLY